MVITQIAGASGARCRIYIDGQFAFVLYKGELRKFHLQEGQELPPDSYREITEEPVSYTHLTLPTIYSV